MRRFQVLRLVYLWGLTLLPLCAENKGWYLSFGPQFSLVRSNALVSQNMDFIVIKDQRRLQDSIAPMGGGNVRLGFKHFFGQNKQIGLRYYFNFGGNGGAWVSQFVYGLGADVMLNFIERKWRGRDFTFGGFVGLLFSVQTWQTGVASVFQGELTASLGGGFTRKVYPVQFQLPLNIGLHLNFSKHQGLDLGIMMPFLYSPLARYSKNFDHDKDSATLTIHRDFSVYLNYTYAF
ncbi:hypothetical protein NHP190012_15360 [Helicobacter sp. NHP19-012]|uniref:Outer membrane protein n=1 Tax=Helicobacter gastrofelis TaxID=2849642 RepID=A0ABM7SJR6_9HELI|nr:MULTISPECIES: outer membrane beta-barrel protein [unclassified Helicobacter]BCZ19894.1 hypothetical protein NHP190012_15360 [Helicobacter sp. NHP19-012]GMB95563.1 hypothetical protein NHP22001_01520 [Helicobacter sp. NHP22-001]